MANPFDEIDPPEPTKVAATSASGSKNPFDEIDEPATNEPMGLGEMFSKAAENVPSSAGKFATDLVQPIIHPVDTAKAIGNVGMGAVEKLIPGGEYPHEKYANAVGEYFKNRYGGVENAKRAFAEDPVGVLSDASMIFTGGGSAVARLPGVMGRVGEIAGTVGRAIDPVMAPVNAVKAGAKTAAELGTHTGAASLEHAFESGVQGGSKGEEFRDAMRGNTPLGDVVDTAREGLSNMRVNRGQEYVRDMSALGQDQTVLDFSGVDKAMQDAGKVKTFKGVDLAPKTAGVRQEISETIDAWKALDPAEYHTPVGFDALKQQIGDIRDHTQYGTPERVVADKAYNAIRGEITKQAPEYAKTMKAYEQASDLIREMESTLSLKQGANIDTSLRKLQSIMRNNVNTNYGRHIELGDMLEQAGAKNLMAKLAGQSLNHWFPRGLGKLEAAGAAIGAFSHPMAAAALPFMSPRLMGEAAHFTGRTVGRGMRSTNDRLGNIGLGNRAVGDLSYEAGRVPNEMPYRGENLGPLQDAGGKSHGGAITRSAGVRRAIQASKGYA